LPLSSADPEKEQLELAKTKAAANLRRLKKENDDSDRESDGGGKRLMSKGVRKQDLALNQYENQIALDVVAPEDIPVGFEGKY
jgi:ATPase family AAA domain-containing protein 1